MARYIDYLKTRKYMCEIWGRTHYGSAALTAADSAGLIVRNVPAEIDGDPTVGKNTDYAPLPY